MAKRKTYDEKRRARLAKWEKARKALLAADRKVKCLLKELARAEKQVEVKLAKEDEAARWVDRLDE